MESMQIDAPDYEMDAGEDIEDCVVGNIESSTSVLVENAPFDVESYISQFNGRGKLQRLMFIADQCPPLRYEALTMALSYVKNETFDVKCYQMIIQKLQELHETASGNSRLGRPNRPPELNEQWMENTVKRAAHQLEQLENSLKSWKASAIKEDIRRGCDALGSHHLACGDFVNGSKCYAEARDYTSVDAQSFEIYLNIIRNLIYQKHWLNAESYILKAEQLAKLPEQKAKLAAFSGLFEMFAQRYKQAADRFVQVQFPDSDTRSPSNDCLSNVMSPNAVAIYGMLCSLATYDRKDLHDKILSGNFKLFLELEPQVREAVAAFYHSKYPVCLSLLESMKDSFRLDLYIGSEIEKLYSMIQDRAFIFYFVPYSCADLNIMSSAFSIPYPELENMLMDLILRDKILARIDSQNRVLYANTCDSRLVTFEKTLRMGQEYRRKAQAVVLKILCARHDIAVRKTKKVKVDPFENVQNVVEEPSQSQESNHSDMSRPSEY